MNFDAFIGEIEKNRWQVYGVEVYREGRLAAEYGDTRERHPLYSITKSFTSLAIGMGMDEGRMDIERPLSAYLPESVMGKMEEGQREIYQKMPLRRLMAMSVPGYPFRPEGESWLLDSLKISLPDYREAAFHYSNIPAYLCGVAAEYALEENLGQYLNRKLFQPLGIKNPPCQYCPEGHFYGASGVQLSVKELSCIGLMLMQGGTFQGERLISEDYLRAATAVQTPTREGGYGYFFWKYRSGFSMNGKWGQKCFILPDEKTMITFLSYLEQGSDGLRASAERYLLD